MSPEAALDAQIERYRHMSGEQRLAIVLELHDLACDVARAGITFRHPEARHRRNRAIAAQAASSGLVAMTEKDLLVDCLRRLL